MRLPIAALLAGFLISLCGCNSAPSCPATFTPCGGDIEGTWAYDSICNGAASQCPGTTTSFTPSIEGTYTFNADKTYTASLSASGSGTEVLPASCFGGTITSCSELDSTTTEGGYSVTESCTGTASQSCTCAVTESGTLTQTGTYSTAGTSVTTTTDGTPAATSPYCVSGSELLLDLGSTASASAAYIIFTKQ